MDRAQHAMLEAVQKSGGLFFYACDDDELRVMANNLVRSFPQLYAITDLPDRYGVLLVTKEMYDEWERMQLERVDDMFRECCPPDCDCMECDDEFEGLMN